MLHWKESGRFEEKNIDISGRSIPNKKILS